VCVCVCVCVCASCEKPSATADYFSALYVCVYTRTLQKTLFLLYCVYVFFPAQISTNSSKMFSDIKMNK